MKSAWEENPRPAELNEFHLLGETTALPLFAEVMKAARMLARSQECITEEIQPQNLQKLMRVKMKHRCQSFNSPALLFRIGELLSKIGKKEKVLFFCYNLNGIRREKCPSTLLLLQEP